MTRPSSSTARARRAPDGVLGPEALVREEGRPLRGEAPEGPSDPRAKTSTREAWAGKGETFGGVDVEGNAREELYRRARTLGVKGASRMKRRELAREIAKKQ